MTEDTNQITADHLRAEFLNASTNWQRWKVLNKALDWAVTASENAAAAREQATELKERIEACSPKAAGFTFKPFNRDAAAEMVTGVRIREGATAKAAGPEGMPASDDIAARLGFVTPEELARDAWTTEEQARNAWTADTMFTGHVVMQPKEDD